MTWDAVVIGAGCAGLATAALLSRRGARVLVLEKGRAPGGRAPVYSRDGFRFNLGIHTPALGPAGPLHAVLREAGKLDRVRFVRPVLNNSWVERGGRLHRMILQPQQLLTTTLLSPGSKMRLGLVLAMLAVERPGRLWQMDLGTWVDAVVGDPAVRQYLLDQAQLMCFEADPESLSAGHYVEAFQATMRASLPFAYVQGSWESVFRALQERIAQGGGEVRFGTRVERLEVSGGAFRAAVLDSGEQIAAQTCVVTVPPQELPGLISPDYLPAQAAQRLAGLEPVAVAALDLGLKEALPVQLAAVHSPDERMLITSYTDGALGLTPPGGQLIQALYFARPGEMAGAGEVAAVHRRMAEVVERHFPGATERAVVRQALAFRKALSVRRRGGQSRVEMLGPGLPGVANLFLAGDGATAPGELGNAAWASARVAAREAERFLRLAP